jgi:hypothetical protein
MENKLHEALQATVAFMKDTYGIEYNTLCRKYEDPLLFKITFIGTHERKVVIELLENGNVSVLQTRDVIYSELNILMNKFMERLA